MLTIRDEQLRLLERSVDERLCAEAVRHIREAVPEVYGELGEEQVLESVALARAKSVEYGFDSWAAVVGYLDVMYILGFAFDEDPRYPWATQILQGFDRSNEERLAQLLQMAMQTAAAADDSVT